MNETNLLYFSFPTEDSKYLLKCGTNTVLDNIRNGKIWFRTLDYYRNYYIKNEVNRNISTIGDKYEGVESILYPKDCLSITYTNPLINYGKTITIDKSGIIGPICNYPDNNFYISCFTYITQKHIQEKNIFDQKYKLEKDWGNVLCFLDTNGFVNNLEVAVAPNSLSKSIVSYKDFTITRDNLDPFIKDSVFEWQREYRIIINLINTKNDRIKIIDNDTIEISFDPVNSFITPIDSFSRNFV